MSAAWKDGRLAVWKESLLANKQVVTLAYLSVEKMAAQMGKLSAAVWVAVLAALLVDWTE